MATPLIPFTLAWLIGIWLASRLLGAAERLSDALGTPFVPAERARHEHSVAAARAGLGEEGFSTARAKGWTMMLEQAAAYASE